MEDIYFGEKIRVSLVFGSFKEAVVTFDHWDPNKKAFRDRRPNSYYASRGFSHFHVESKVSDWFENSERDDAFRALCRDLSGFDFRLSIGFSMGAYGAFIAGNFLAFDECFLVSPIHFRAGFTDFLPRSGSTPSRDHTQFRGGNAQFSQCAIVVDPKIDRDWKNAQWFADRTSSGSIIEAPNHGHPARPAPSAVGKRSAFMRAMTSRISFENKLQRIRRSLSSCSHDSVRKSGVVWDKRRSFLRARSASTALLEKQIYSSR